MTQITHPDIIPSMLPDGAGEIKRRLDDLIPEEALELAERGEYKGIPAIAKNSELTSRIEALVREVDTSHNLALGDARDLQDLPDESIHLAVTSPPYWTLKKYPDTPGQMGDIEDYDRFLDELDQVWREIYRALVSGGRLVIVVGDVCMSRRQFGRHVVFPLHGSIQERCRELGFDNLNPILWHKVANIEYEIDGTGGGFLGKPYEPNAVIKNDLEYILFQRKPGGYRSPSTAERILSVIPEQEHSEWFQQIWRISGASTKDHPAPFPLELAERLVRMFSFVGDVVLDPFMGTGTVNLAASKWGRNSIGIEIEPEYYNMALERMEDAGEQQLSFQKRWR